MNRFRWGLLGLVIFVVSFIATTTYLSIPKVYIDLKYFITEYQKNENDYRMNGAKQSDYRHELLKTFANEYVYYIGEVNSVDRYNDYTYVIYMNRYNPINQNSVRCYIDAEWKELVYSLERSQIIKIRGIFDDFFLGISIHDCEIVLED